MAKYGRIIKKKIGRETHAFVVNGDSMFEIVEGAKTFSFPDVYKCGNCGGDHLHLGSHVTKGDELQYTHITCKDCKARVNFGQQKKSDVVYLRTKKNPDGSPMKDPNGWPVYDWRVPPADFQNQNNPQ